MKYPNFREEKKLWQKGFKKVVGLDEAGRGSLAGPVVASAVVITTAKIKNQISKIKNTNQNLKLLTKIKDSKKLSLKKREKLYKLIIKSPFIEWGIGMVSEKVIDKINIKNAAELAMERVLKNLEKKIKKRADFLIIDGNHLKNLQLTTYNLKLLIKADERVFSCAAASIIAKVTRDRIMKKYHQKYPQYGFDKHKGYPTNLHLKMLRKYGPCKIHRKSFKPNLPD
jgi:ribonuclease HII